MEELADYSLIQKEFPDLPLMVDGYEDELLFSPTSHPGLDKTDLYEYVSNMFACIV